MRLPVDFPPKTTVSKPVSSLEGVSSCGIRQEHSELERRYWKAKRLWSGSCVAGNAGSVPPDMVKRYIEEQQHPGWTRIPADAGRRADHRHELASDLKAGTLP